MRERLLELFLIVRGVVWIIVVECGGDIPIRQLRH